MISICHRDQTTFEFRVWRGGMIWISAATCDVPAANGCEVFDIGLRSTKDIGLRSTKLCESKMLNVRPTYTGSYASTWEGEQEIF